MANLQIHTNLWQPATPQISLPGIARGAGFVGIVAAGLCAYVAIAVWVAGRLRFDFSAAYWMAAGILCLALGFTGWAKHLRFYSWPITFSEKGITIYVIAIGVGMLGFGGWRQIAIDQALHRCTAELASADDAHARIRILFRTGANGLPNLGDRSMPSAITCEQLIHR